MVRPAVAAMLVVAISLVIGDVDAGVNRNRHRGKQYYTAVNYKRQDGGATASAAEPSASLQPAANPAAVPAATPIGTPAEAEASVPAPAPTAETSLPPPSLSSSSVAAAVAATYSQADDASSEQGGGEKQMQPKDDSDDEEATTTSAAAARSGKKAKEEEFSAKKGGGDDDGSMTMSMKSRGTRSMSGRENDDEDDIGSDPGEIIPTSYELPKVTPYVLKPTGYNLNDGPRSGGSFRYGIVMGVVGAVVAIMV
ncbi:hypothetical protein AYI69_g1900 [Smittium culicis]|uniref:Uncharacterized protein n=1 Tax=Smittium culicis TaxID=133412 RepID=A0A1R1YNY7_9FUNG|nr:hypothetical protein AYI69_g1900 [Smittium culicis]